MIVRHLEMLPGTKTARPLELDKDHGFAWIQGGLWANIKKRDIWNIKSIWHIKDDFNIEDIWNIQDFQNIGSREASGRIVRRDIWMFKVDIFVASLWQDASFWYMMQQLHRCNFLSAGCDSQKNAPGNSSFVWVRILLCVQDRRQVWESLTSWYV